jgi:hypothetical protein
MPYASNTNAILIDGCNNLQNITVLLEVTEDLATIDGSGWSFQLNCYVPPGEYCQTSPVNWVQYLVVVQGGFLQYYVQYWSYGTSAWPPGYVPTPGTAPWLPCWPDDSGNATTFNTDITGDTLPAGSKLQISLGTNAHGGVTTATFLYTNPQDSTHEGIWHAPAVHPISAFELNLVGAPGGWANFTQGIQNSRGIITYSISGGQLSVQNGGPGSACGQAAVNTGEGSNMPYSDINDAPGPTVWQILQQPVPCAITSVSVTSVSASDHARLDEMKQLRDVEIVKYPAGEWLIEVLDRHSADLALIFSSDERDLAQSVRELLASATDAAREGLIFDDATVDNALKVLGQVSCKMPPSMQGVGPACETVLRSLRGRTLEDGLQEASKTIIPRFRVRRG